MLQDISSAIRFESPAASAVLYTAAGLLAGRKFCMAAGYRMGGVVAGLLGKQNVAEWNQASNAYLTLAKKDAVRDLTAVASLLAVTVLAIGPKETVLPKKEPKNETRLNSWGQKACIIYGLFNATFFGVNLLLSAGFSRMEKHRKI